jgi:hypothetical protein
VFCLNKGGITTFDQVNGWSWVSGQGTLTRECRFCAIAQLVGDCGTPAIARYVEEDVDEDVVVVSRSGLDGLVVIPRRHVGGLEELAVAHRARVLAALRRVARSIQERNPGSAARVVEMTDPAESDGHISFRVVARASQDR